MGAISRIPENELGSSHAEKDLPPASHIGGGGRQNDYEKFCSTTAYPALIVILSVIILHTWHPYMLWC